MNTNAFQKRWRSWKGVKVSDIIWFSQGWSLGFTGLDVGSWTSAFLAHSKWPGFVHDHAVSMFIYTHFLAHKAIKSFSSSVHGSQFCYI